MITRWPSLNINFICERDSSWEMSILAAESLKQLAIERKIK